MIHDIKLHKRFVWPLADGDKTFEVRRNDRDYQESDSLRFHVIDGNGGAMPAWSNESKVLDGRMWSVTYVLGHDDFPDGIMPGYCVLGIRKMDKAEYAQAYPWVMEWQ